MEEAFDVKRFFRVAANLFSVFAPQMSGGLREIAKVSRPTQNHYMRFRVIDTTWRNATGPLLSELRGRMFHATSPEGFIGICSEGAILSNVDGRFKPNWTEDYYFKNHGCLSVVDLVSNTRPRVTRRKLISDYSVFEQASPVVVFLLLSPSVYSRAVHWKKYKRDRAYGQQIVPEIESGIPDRVAIEEIDEAWFITIKDRVASSGTFNAIYDNARAKDRAAKAQ